MAIDVLERHASLRSYLRQCPLIKLLLLSTALIGFCVQAIQVSVLYFAYQTTSQVDLIARAVMVPHSIPLCIRYADILDRDKLWRDTRIRVGPMTDLDESIAEESTLTLAQIFHYTPSPSNLLDACFIRSLDWTFTVHVGKDCGKLFHVSKSFTLEFMCYRFEPLASVAGLYQESAVQSRYKQYTIFDVTLNRRMKNASYVLPVTYVGTYPYVSRRYSQTTLMRSLQGDRVVYNWIDIFRNDYVIQKLASPYDTACIRRPFDEYWQCRRDCLVDHFVRNMSRLPVSEFLEQALPFKFISTADLHDPRIGHRVGQWYDHCHSNCYFNPCDLIYTKTTFRTQLFKEFHLAFSSKTPTEADIVTRAQAIMTFIEYFSFMTGCVGTWFGLHFLSLTQVPCLKRLFGRSSQRKPLTSSHQARRSVFPVPVQE